VVELSEGDATFAATVSSLLGEGAPPKWKLTQLMNYLKVKENIDTSALWQKIKSIINLTILCLCNQKIPSKVAASCFELFGFGIFILSSHNIIFKLIF
jgi:hypothetical protein